MSAMKNVCQDTKPNAARDAGQIKFGIRFGNQLRGKIIRGITIEDYLKSLGASCYGISPSGGFAIIDGVQKHFGITIY